MKDSDIRLLKSVCKDHEAFEKAKTLLDRLNSEKSEAIQSLELLESAIRNDYDAIVITELDVDEPTIVYVNDGFVRMTGYSREEAIGNTPKLLQGPKTDREVLDRLKSSIQQGKSFFGQAINYRKDGSEFVNQWDIHPLINQQGEITHWVSYQHDITERKEVEKALTLTEADHENIYQCCSRTLVDFLEDGRIVFANKCFLDLTGYPMEELDRFRIWDLMSGHPGKLSSRQFETLWNSGVPVKTFNTLLKQKNGLPVQVEVNLETVMSNKEKTFRANIENLSLRKKVFNTLKKRNTDYKKLMSNKSDFKYRLVMDATGKPYFSWLSEGFLNVTGFKPDDCMTKTSWKCLIHPKDADKVITYLKSALEGQSACSEYRIKTREGKFRRVLDHAKIDETDQNTINGSIVDITLTRV